jgi:hypothetical protein
MSILIVFRGNCDRNEQIDYIYENHKIKISNYLEENGYKIDYLISSYNENLEILDKWARFLNPIQIFTMNSHGSNQAHNFIFTIKNIHNHVDYKNYDKILIIRFDIIYKRGMKFWNILNKNGFIVPFKEDSIELYNNTKYTADSIMWIDTKIFHKVYISLSASYTLYCINHNLKFDEQKEPPFKSILHNVPNIISYFYPEINIDFFIDGFWQSCTVLEKGDKRLNPLFINLFRQYNNDDINLCLINDNEIDTLY